MLVLSQKPNDRIIIYYEGKPIGEIQNAGRTKVKIGITLPPAYKVLRDKLAPKT